MEDFDIDETAYFETENLALTSTVPLDVHDNLIEVVAAVQATNIKAKSEEKCSAKIKIDTNHPLVNNTQQTQEKEEPFKVKVDSKILAKPYFTEIEPLQVTEIDVGNTVDECVVSKLKPEINATKDIVAIEGYVTTETISNMTSVDQIDKNEQQKHYAKSSVMAQDAINISQDIPSLKEGVLKDEPITRSFASISITPLSEVSITEVNDEDQEQKLVDQWQEKPVKTKVDFKLLESVQVGEVFVEDKSGKYYPELIVPTETARKDILLSNQILTQVHDVQEKEGYLNAMKYPPSQEASMDIMAKDSVMVSVSDLQEKEEELPTSHEPIKATADKDLLLHSGLDNFVTVPHIKESDIPVERFVSKNANIEFNEHRHQFHVETNAIDSEKTLEESKSLLKTCATISISALDNNMVEEIYVNEKEENLILKDEKHTAVADLDLKSLQALITSETLQMSTVKKLPSSQKISEEAAVESMLTESAKVISIPMVHDQEVPQDLQNIQDTKKICTNIIPNLSLSITETQISERETSLQTKIAPEVLHAQLSTSHPLKTPISEEITSADQIDFIKTINNVVEKVLPDQNLHKEITVLQTTVQEQIQMLNESKQLHGKANTSLISSEGINIIETISTFNEEYFEPQKHENSKFATVEVDIDHRVPLISELNPSDALDKIPFEQPHYKEAHVIPNTFTQVQVSESHLLDSQKPLQDNCVPDKKFLNPEVVALQGSLMVIETLQHEKEGMYQGDQLTECFSATPGITGRPVAVASELVADNTVGLTDQLCIKDKSRQATLDNVYFKEVIVSTTDSIEKESFLKTPKPKMFEALLNVDSNEALEIQDFKSEINPMNIKSTINESLVKAKQDRIPMEAISQQEVIVHTVEGALKQTEPNLQRSLMSVSAFQVPECDENISVENEMKLSIPVVPTHIADLTIIEEHSLQTSEVLSHSDNLKRSDDFKISYKQALPNMDIYGKAAKVEETLISHATDDFSESEISSFTSNVVTDSLNVLEQTETIIAEKEIYLEKGQNQESNAKLDYKELQAILMSSVQAGDKEEDLTIPYTSGTKNFTVEYIPLKSTINTEVITSNNIDKITDTIPNKFQATEAYSPIQEQILGLEVICIDKEANMPYKKRDSELKAKESVIESAAKEVIEIQVVEKEKDIHKLENANRTTANAVLTEEQHLQSTEVLTSQVSKDLQTQNTEFVNANSIYELQEATQNTEQFVGESEGSLTNEVISTKTTKSVVESMRSVDVTEIITSESGLPLAKVKDDEIKNVGTKHVNVLTQPSLNISETIISEKEGFLPESKDHAMKTADFIVKPIDYINITENVMVETEEELKPYDCPKATANDVQLETYKHLSVEMLQLNESEEIMKTPDVLSREVNKISIESTKPILIDEVRPEEIQEQFTVSAKIRETYPSMNFQLSDSVNVSEVLSLEKDINLPNENIEKVNHIFCNIETAQHVIINEVKTSESELIEVRPTLDQPKGVEQIFETHSSLQVQEVLPKESNDKLYNREIPKTEQIDIQVNAQHHIMVTDINPREKEEFLNIESIPFSDKQRLDVAALDHFTTIETTILEGQLHFQEKQIQHYENVQKTQQVSEVFSNEEQQVMDSCEKINIDYKPEGLKPTLSIKELEHSELEELLPQEIPVSMENIHLSHKNAKIVQAPSKEIVNICPEVIESIGNMSNQKFEGHGIFYELQLNKSYITAECAPLETFHTMENQDKKSKTIEQQLLDHKSIEQIEIISDENILPLQLLSKESNEKAEVKHLHFKELSYTTQDAFENVSEISELFRPEINTASFDVETHKTYSVSENTVHEKTLNIETPFTSQPNKINEEIMQVMPIEFTEVVLGEIENKLNVSKNIREENISFNTVESEPLNLMDVILHESVVNENFEQPIKPSNASFTIDTYEGVNVYEIKEEDFQEKFDYNLVKSATAESSFTTLTHLQCTENITETQTDAFKTLLPHSKTTSTKTTSFSPLIVTDTVSLQNESPFMNNEPEKQKLRETLTLSDELEVTEKIIGEQLILLQDEHPKALKTMFTTTDDNQQITADVQSCGK